MSNEQLKIEYLPWKNENGEKSLRKDQLKENFNDKFFDDLNKWNVTIKKQWNIYIFEQKDITSSRISDDNNYVKKFYVKENVFEDYLKIEKKKEEISLDSDKLLKEFLDEINIKNELNTLEDDVVNVNQVEQSPESLNAEIDNLLDWLKLNKSRPKAPRISENRYSKHRFEQVIKDDISSLESIKRELKRYNYTTNIDQFKNYVNEIKNHKEQLEKVRQIITTGWNTSEIPAMLDSLKDIKKESLFQTIAANYNVEYNIIMKNATINKLWNKDMEWFQEYLKLVWTGDIEYPEQDKFYIKHKKDFEYILSIDPWLYGEITNKKETKKNNINNNKSESRNLRNIKWVDKWWNIFSDALVKLWIIDENDKTKQEAWGKFGKVWVIGLWLYALYKIITTKGKWRWWWIIWSAWGLLALNNSDQLQKRFKDAFGKKNPSCDDITEITNIAKEDADEYIKPQTSMIRCMWSVPIKTMVSWKFIKEEGGKMRLDYKLYEEHIRASSMSKEEQNENIKAMLEIKNDKTGNMIDKSLKYMWINSISDLDNLAGDDENKTLLDTDNVSKYFENLSSPINSDLATEWFVASSPTAWYKITNEYIWSKPSNEKILEWISKGYLKLNETKNYTLDWMINNSSIESLKDKTIKWLKNNSGNLIKFGTYKELFDVVQLSQFIKENFKWKAAKDNSEPFHINTLWNIEFDNTEWYEVWKNETNVINSNFYKNTLQNVSTTLWQHKENYVKYINDRWKVEWKLVN